MRYSEGECGRFSLFNPAMVDTIKETPHSEVPLSARHFANALANKGDCVSSPTDANDNSYSTANIRCALAHEHVLMRQGLRRLLEDEPDLEVVSEAGNAAECLRKVHEFRPDVVIADNKIFGLSASEAELLLERISNHTRLFFLNIE